MFETLAQFEKLVGTSLAYRGVNGEFVLSDQKEVDKYRVCSGDNFTEFGPYVKFQPWHGFIAVSKDVDFAPYKPCTGFVFSSQ